MKGMKYGILLIAVMILFVSCENTEDDAENGKILNVRISADEIYSYDTGIGGDEEGVVIKVQAQHFEISEILRNQETNFSPVYRYKATAGYIGRDYVALEIQQGSDGASPNTLISTIEINITVE